jgi:hypothetical protein
MKNRMVKGMCGVGVALMMAGMFASGARAQDQSGAQSSQDQKSAKADDGFGDIKRWTDADLVGMVPAAKPADVASPSAIVAATYDVISGPKGSPRDWDRWRSLFLPTGRLGTLGHPKEGGTTLMSFTAEDYVKLGTSEFDKTGFFERGIVNKINKFGDVAEVFTSYESRYVKGGPVVARGINNFQCMFDGKRWWIESIVWDEEHGDLKLPASMAGGSTKAATTEKKEEGK